MTSSPLSSEEEARLQAAKDWIAGRAGPRIPEEERLAHLQRIARWAALHPNETRRPFEDGLAEKIIEMQIKTIDRLVAEVVELRAKVGQLPQSKVTG